LQNKRGVIIALLQDLTRVVFTYIQCVDKYHLFCYSDIFVIYSRGSCQCPNAILVYRMWNICVYTLCIQVILFITH